MTIKELGRFKEINMVIEKKRTQRQAAKNLGLSVRQVKRLCKSVRTFGPKGLISKKRGSKGNYRLADIFNLFLFFFLIFLIPVKTWYNIADVDKIVRGFVPRKKNQNLN